ncbi:hypothetical protein RHMOL_Rhmol02G0158500 [Rhododendron molle]|uniref:Uncharacterized protein n=1 Tax=Rhododendron molle TaxID=49168 RepID=A0ACC0PS07_RHOML|nr:hypothetical protein RHMOL_Rhmol02G0158500 [Rhododendron molle]
MLIGRTSEYSDSKLLSHIGSIGKEEKDIGIVNPGDVKFGSRKYYRYIGSLTVPPCTEGVIWTIVKKVRTVSREQVRALRDVVHDCVRCSLWSSWLREMKFEGYVAKDGTQSLNEFLAIWTTVNSLYRSNRIACNIDVLFGVRGCGRWNSKKDTLQKLAPRWCILERFMMLFENPRV